MSRSRKRKIKKLCSRLKYLKAHTSDVREIHEEYQRVWADEYYRIRLKIADDKESCDGQSSAEDESSSCSSDPTTREEEKEDREDSGNLDEDESGPETPKWAKNLYRKIAMLTHPDRIAGDPDELLKTKLFTRAADAMRSGKLDDLVDVAIEAGIDVDLNDAEVERRIQNKIDDAENDLHSMENCIAWTWCESESDEQMVQIIKQAFAHDGIAIPEDDEILSLIKGLDEI